MSGREQNDTVRRGGVRMKALLAVLLAAAVLMSVPTATVSAESQSELEERLEQLKEQEKELRSKIDSYGDDLDAAQAKQDAIYEQVANTEEQIDLLNQRISGLEQEIAGKDTAIAEKEQLVEGKRAQIQEIYDALRVRLRTIAKSGTGSSLQMLMNNDSYADYLLKSKMLQVVSETDQKHMDEVEAEIRAIQAEEDELNADKTLLAEQMSEIASLRGEVEVKKLELDNLLAAAKAETERIQSNIDNYRDDLKQTEQEMAELEEQIKEIIRENTGTSSSHSFLSGSMYWPAPTCTIITDVFGPRMLNGVQNYHRGVDLARYGSAHGHEIVAAYDGEVIYANTSGDGGGYGYYVIIDHGSDSAGRNICTLYAHMSKVYASVGDQVKGGETLIGLIGNTGNSYGAHLHFEVRVDGTAVDPFSNGYIKRP